MRWEKGKNDVETVHGRPEVASPFWTVPASIGGSPIAWADWNDAAASALGGGTLLTPAPDSAAGGKVLADGPPVGVLTVGELEVKLDL